MNQNRTYHDVFDKWTEVSAYILGFWYADGHIYLKKQKHKYHKMFVITNTNKQIIDDIAVNLGHKTQVNGKSDKLKNTKDSFRVTIYSDKLFDYCYDVIGTTHKSSQSNMPNISDDYVSHFMRGFFDGDGSIYYTTYKNRHGKPTSQLRTSFTSGIEAVGVLHWVAQQLSKHVGLPDREPHGLVSKHIKYGQYHSALLCEWLYKDATIFMNRKKAIWDAADKKRLLESRKYMRNPAPVV